MAKHLMPYERTTIRRKHDRFALVKCTENDDCMTIVDRDAVPTHQADPQPVARVLKAYAEHVCALMEEAAAHGQLKLRPVVDPRKRKIRLVTDKDFA